MLKGSNSFARTWHSLSQLHEVSPAMLLSLAGVTTYAEQSLAAFLSLCGPVFRESCRPSVHGSDEKSGSV